MSYITLTMFRFFWLLILFLLTLTAKANCPAGLAFDVAMRLHPGQSVPNWKGLTVWPEGDDLTTCKLWPDDPLKAIIVIAFFHEGSGFTSESKNDRTQRLGLYDLDVLVVRSDTGETLSRRFTEGAISSDSNKLYSISIDTARYKLAPDVRAFGIRINHSDSRREYSYNEEHLNLYVTSGEKLKLVLDQYQTVNSGGATGECVGNFSDIRRTLAIGKTINHGYADLTVTINTNHSELKTNNGKCVEIKQPMTVTQETLRFDGKVYR